MTRYLFICIRKNDNNNDNSNRNEKENNPFIVLPFNKFITLIINHTKKYKVLQNNRTINKFNSFIELGKDKLKTVETSNVSYKVDCDDCPASSVGLTNLTSALVLHIDNTGHNIQYDSFKIINPENIKKKREFSEVLRIYYFDNTEQNRKHKRTNA